MDIESGRMLKYVEYWNSKKDLKLCDTSPFVLANPSLLLEAIIFFFYFYLFSAQQTRKTDRVLQSFKYHNDEEKTFEL